jgi:hypothetical protein
MPHFCNWHVPPSWPAIAGKVGKGPGSADRLGVEGSGGKGRVGVTSKRSEDVQECWRREVMGDV